MLTDRLTDLADAFHGVDNGGNTLCGPHLPLGMVRPGPDTWPPVQTNTNGYASQNPIARFSQTHVSGTGGQGRYGNIAITPFAGPPTLQTPLYDKCDETASPGYYCVEFPLQNIRTEITCTQHVAVYRFTFPAGTNGCVLLDTGAVLRCYPASESKGQPRCTGGFVTHATPTETIGRGDLRGGWGHDHPYSIHFALEASVPAKERYVSEGDFLAVGRETVEPGAKAVLEFGEVGTVEVRIGISNVSVGNARKHLKNEAMGQSFETICAQAQQSWETLFAKIRVEGAEEDCRLFYSTFMRMMCMPADLGIDNEHPGWVSGVRHFWDYYCLWDSVRGANQLIALFDPELHVDMLNNLIDIAEHTGWLPEAWIAGNHAHAQGGAAADILLCEAAERDLPGIDYARALVHMRRNREENSPEPFHYGRYLEGYRKLGYIPVEEAINCVSKTIEYSYSDWCIARFAERLGETQVAQEARADSERVWSLWREDLHAFGPKRENGEWDAFDPAKPSRWDYWLDPHFYEGTAYEWSLCVCDPHALVERVGGPDAFGAYLDKFFANRLWHWKEVILHTPWLYHFAGRPDDSTRTARALLRKQYSLGRTGYDGNEDMGANSAYVMWTMLGLYPWMGRAIYFLHAPMLRVATISLGASGKAIRITTTGTPGGDCIRSVTWNGEMLARTWIRHSELAAGGELVFDLGTEPGVWASGQIPPPH